MELKPEAPGGKSSQELIPRLRTMGFFFILIAVLALVAGKFRNELALTLLGTVFLVILAYCFVAVFLSGLIYRRKIQYVTLAIINEVVSTGREGLLSIAGENAGKAFFWRLPAVILRCELCLETKDKRVISCFIDPDHERDCTFPVKERGAYYGEYDRYMVFDAPGLFSLCLPVYRSKGPRLLAVPLPAEGIVPVPLKPGGSEERKEPHYRKSDEFLDHRPYVPGDDPRRINWKLYSHAPLGELFVREGEPEPPPNSRLLVLLDTEVDQSLYTKDEGRRAVDLLCESAMALALDYLAKGLDISIGWSGGTIIGNRKESGPLSAAEISSALAWPAALRFLGPPARSPGRRAKANTSGSTPETGFSGTDLPKAPEDMAILILALPRAFSGNSPLDTPALDRFLSKREARQEVDILFLYDSGNQRTISRKARELEDAARVCVNLYNKRPGIHSSLAAVSHAQGGESQ